MLELLAAASLVTRVIDGDTVALGRESVRLYAIDAPELHRGRACRGERLQTPRCDFAAGRRAKQALAELVEGREVEVERLGCATDGKRTVARLRYQGRDVGRWLVAHGHAWETRGYAGACYRR